MTDKVFESTRVRVLMATLSLVGCNSMPPSPSSPPEKNAVQEMATEPAIRRSRPTVISRALKLPDPERSASRGLGARAVATPLLFDASSCSPGRYGGCTGVGMARLRRELDSLLHP